jgi:ligand-binding SRPBCC domain-containing protein
MPHLELAIDINAPPERLWEFHQDARNLLRISPPTVALELVGENVRVFEGAHIALRTRLLGRTVEWESCITECRPPYSFTDTAVRGPLQSWRHQHLFQPLPQGGTRLIDRIDYEPPRGLLGVLFTRLRGEKQLRALLEYRQRKTKALLEKEENWNHDLP